MSESFVDVTNIQKIRQCESFKCLNLLQKCRISESFAKIVKLVRYSKHSKDSGKNFESNLLNVRIFCKCDKYSKDSPMRIFRISESFAKVKIVSKIHQSVNFTIFAKDFHICKRFRHSKDLHWRVF